MTEPVFVTLKARDVKPYHYGVWCSIEDNEPFANTICYIRWSDDGKYLWFGLDSHNTMKVEPDEEVEVIPVQSVYTQRTRDKYAAWTLPLPPKPKPTRYDHRYKWSADGPECDLCGAQHEPNLEPEDDA